MADGPDGAAVGECLVDRQVESGVVRLELGPVQWTAAAFEGGPTAGRAAERRVIGALLEQEHLHASVRRRFQRLGPARGGSAVSAGLLAPALERLSLVLCL